MTEEQIKLVEENIGLVGKTITKYFHKYLGDEDVYQQGCLGLINAAKAFNPSKGYRFSTLAVRSIKNSILHLFRNKNTLKRGMTCEILSFDANSSELLKILASNESVEKEAINKILYEKVIEYLNQLSPQQRQAITLYYLEGYSQEAIGKIRGCSQGAIKQNLKLGLRNLRTMLGVM